MESLIEAELSCRVCVGAQTRRFISAVNLSVGIFRDILEFEELLRHGFRNFRVIRSLSPIAR